MPDSSSTSDNRRRFVGRINELRVFDATLQKLLQHQALWKSDVEARIKAHEPGYDFNYDPAYEAPADDSYARIFILHGIGGIGKTWLTREMLRRAESQGENQQLLTWYCDVSVGVPEVQTPADLLARLTAWLVEIGYAGLEQDYQATAQKAQSVSARVLELAERRQELFQRAGALAGVAVEQATAIKMQSAGGMPLADGAGGMIRQSTAATLNKSYELFVGMLREKGELTEDEVEILRDPLAVQARQLVNGLRSAAVDGPFVLALDTLEFIPHLETFLRDYLVLPLQDAPILWILSGRFDLSTERIIESGGKKQVQKGYRDLLASNPPIAWDMTAFSDADIKSFLEAEGERRSMTPDISETVVDTIKRISGGVPLAVDLTTEAYFTLGSQAFVAGFDLADGNLLPKDKLAVVADRFLRYCLTDAREAERIRTLALLGREADELALRAVWQLDAGETPRAVLAGLQQRYALMRGDSLHDVVYDLLRRQLLTARDLLEQRNELGGRALAHYQAQWEQEQPPDEEEDIGGYVRDPRWQSAALDLLNARLFAQPDQALSFLVPCYVDGVAYDLGFVRALLDTAEPFLGDNARPLRRAHSDQIRRIRAAQPSSPLTTSWWFSRGDEAQLAVADLLLRSPALQPRQRCALNLWRARCWQEEQHTQRLAALNAAADDLTPITPELQTSIGEAFNQLANDLLWPDPSASSVPSPSGLRAAQQAVALVPAKANAWYNLGVALDDLGQYDEAIAAYEKSFDLQPRAIPMNGLGNVYRELNQHDEAIAAYRRAVELDPKFAYPHNGLGNMYRDQGQYDEAIAAYERAVELDPKYATPHNGLGTVYSDQGQPDEAIAAYRRAVELDPKDAYPHNGLGNVYRDQGQYDEAIAAYERAVELDPKFATPHNNLGNVYRALGQYDAAIAAYERAVELDPKFATPHHGLGIVYDALGQYDEAIAAYERAVELDPKDAASYGALAGIYRAQGDEAAYRRYLALAQPLIAAENEYNRACFASISGDVEAALALLQAAIAKSPGWKLSARREPDFAFIRHDPRFQALVAE